MRDLLTRDMMHDYQNRSVGVIKDKKYCALWLDMGLGKTVSTATAFTDLMNDFSVGRVLIIAPKRVAVTTWPLELRNWEHLLGLSFSVINGTAKERTAAILKRADVHIISRDNIRWLVSMVGDQWPWDMVVVDESSSFKSQSSNRWKALKSVRKYIRRMVQLSATPSPQGLHDLWAQFYLLDRGKRLGATEKSFLSRWFNVNREHHSIEPKKHTKEEIYDIISDITIHMSAEDYLDMPELIINRVEIDLPKKVREDYKRFERESLIQLKEYEETFNYNQTETELVETFKQDVEIIAENAATLTGKLLQFANGAVYTDDIGSYKVVHDEKIEALKEIIETHSGTPILVAYNFKSDLDRIRKAFPQAVMMDDDPQTQVDWNDGKIPILLTHPASSGHGLNLQRGSNIIVWFGLNWSLELYMQLRGRLYRQGQTQKSVIVHHIVARDTVDDRVMKILEKKETTQSELLSAVKAL